MEVMTSSAKHALPPPLPKVLSIVNDTPLVYVDTVREELERRTAQDIFPWMKDATPIWIDSSTNLMSALMILMDNKILSAPMWDNTRKSFTGFIDMVDMVAATVEILKEEIAQGHKIDEENSSALSEEADEEIQHLEEHLVLDRLSVSALADMSHRDVVVSVSPSDSLLRVAELLSSGNHHRVAVIDNTKLGTTDALVGVITQSALCEFISEELADLFYHNRKRIKELTLPSKVHVIQSSLRAIDAFKMMRDLKVSGLAVVDDSGRLTDVISVRDIMLWTEWSVAGQSIRFHNLTTLFCTVKSYLEQSRSQNHVPRRFPLTCSLSDPLHDAIEKMLLNNIHRLFVVNEVRSPISVVTYGDVLGEIIKEESPKFFKHTKREGGQF